MPSPDRTNTGAALASCRGDDRRQCRIFLVDCPWRPESPPQFGKSAPQDVRTKSAGPRRSLVKVLGWYADEGQTASRAGLGERTTKQLALRGVK